MFGLGTLGQSRLGGKHSGGGGAWNPLDLFASGEQGAWYDPSDLSTMFQDSTGTTPVTAVGQPVGLILDKSQGLALGPELFTGPIAYNANGTINIVGDTITATCTVAGQFGFISQSNLVSNSVCLISGNKSANPSGKTIYIFPNLDASQYSLGSGLGSFGVTYSVPSAGGFSANTTYVVNGGIVGDSFSITLPSTKKIPGNHASQATAAKRPLLQNDGVNNYLNFDGVDDSLATGSIDFTSTDKMSVFCGVRKFTNTGDQMFVELSPGNGNGSFYHLGPAGSGQNYQFSCVGSVSPMLTGFSATTFNAPISNVTSVLYDLAGAIRDDEVKVRIDGIIPTLSGIGNASAGSGNFGGWGIYLASRANTSLFFNGRIYSLIVLGRLATTQEITETEQWVAGKTGVTLP